MPDSGFAMFYSLLLCIAKAKYNVRNLYCRHEIDNCTFLFLIAIIKYNVLKGETIMKTDLQIAQECTMLPIEEIAQKAGIAKEYIECYGKYKAKISSSYYDTIKER